MDKDFFKILIVVLIMLFVYIIVNNLFSSNLEAFSVNDIGKMTDDVKNISKMADSIPDKINNLSKTIDNKFVEFEKKVESQTTNIVTNKIKSVFEQIGAIFNEGLITPITILFNGIGNIFVQIFSILNLIVNKIITLPTCMFTYMMVEFFNTLYGIYRWIMPTTLANIISTIYSYTLKVFVDFFMYFFGIDAKIQKCYGFNVNKEIDSMNSQFKNINTSFKQDFGKLDFSKIKI
jgi:hypothetical protein